MKLAAHQLQYMPGLRFFAKMRGCDEFVYLDDVQYEKREFQNRNRIRTKDGWQYITVPVMVKGRFEQNIGAVELNGTYDWASEHLTAIRLNYARARYFKEYFPGLEELYGRKYELLGELALATIDFMRKAFDIGTPARLSSGLGIKTSSTQRLVDICRACGADEYHSGAGARDYLKAELFEKNGIALSWQDFTVLPYPQVFDGFEPNMSALDLLLNCGPDSKKYL